MMAPKINLALVWWQVIPFIIFAFHHGTVRGQSCSNRIQAEPGSRCSTDRWHIMCGSAEERPQIFRDDVQLYNGSVLSPEIATRAGISTPSSSTCMYATIVFSYLASEDTGNYTCRTSGWESEAVELTVEEPVGQHACMIESFTGLIVQAGDDVTMSCTSDTGTPSWIGLDVALNASVVTRNYYEANLTLTASSSATFTCWVMSDPGPCPQVNTTCTQSIVVLPQPIDQYLSIEPQIVTTTVGKSARFTCTTTLTGSRVLIRPTELIPLEQYAIFELSDTTIDITFNNITQNYTDPVVTCIMLYNNVSVAETFGSVVVYPEEEAAETTPPTFTTDRTTVTETTPSETTDGLSSGVTITSEMLTLSQSTTLPQNVTGSKVVMETSGTTLLIIILVVVMVIFILVAVLVALIFRWKARKRGEWTVGLISGRGAGGGDVASNGGLEGRLEWETYNDESTSHDVASTTFVNSIEDHEELVTDIEFTSPAYDLSPTVPNGHAFQPGNDGTVIRVDAVIENRSSPTSTEVVTDAEAIVSKDADVAKDGIENQCFVIDEEDEEESPSEVNRNENSLLNEIFEQFPRVATDHVIPNGHIASLRDNRSKEDSRNSDEMEGGSLDDVAFNDEVEFENLKFVDATKFDERSSHRDQESGFGPSPESVLSEIDDGAINIVAV